MNGRVSSIDKLSSISLDASSVLQIGDSKEIVSVANVLAVQREKAIFFENEFNFGDYDIFVEPIPIPPPSKPIHITAYKEAPVIRVHKVDVPFVAASSIIHIGSNDHIALESRIKNIRHLLREKS